MADPFVFASRAEADEWRDRFETYTSVKDDARELTVRFKETIPDQVRDIVGAASAVSLAEEEITEDQVALTDQEETEIERRGVQVDNQNRFRLRAIKAVALNRGVVDWVNKADLQLTANENKEVLANVSGQEGFDPDQAELRRLRDILGSFEESNERIQREVNEIVRENGPGPVADAVADLPTAPDDLRERVQDILDDPLVTESVFTAAVRDEVGQTLDVLNEELVITEEERLEQASERGERRGRQQTLRQLENALGQQFESPEEAAETVRNRIERAQGGGDVLRTLDETFDRPIDTAEDAITAIREEAGIDVAREEVLDSLSERFEPEFDSVDEAVAYFNEQLEQAQRRLPSEIALDEPNERAERFISIIERGEEV